MMLQHLYFTAELTVHLAQTSDDDEETIAAAEEADGVASQAEVLKALEQEAQVNPISTHLTPT